MQRPQVKALGVLVVAVVVVDIPNLVLVEPHHVLVLLVVLVEVDRSVMVRVVGV
jgi:hypothetical protein